ncbi:MAG: S9 family peptidase [Saprospiraceae bacterium]|nr:S9 family peptidase [Saprospiraceae bacterium]
MKQPKAKKIPTELTIHGDTRIDPYYWLNQREDPSVIAYLEAENAYREAKMAHTKPFQEQLYKEIVARFAQTDMSVPYRYHGYWYIARYEEGQEYPIYSRKKETLEADEEIMLDVNDMAKGHEYYSIGGRSISPDNKWLAFGVDTVSRRIYTLYFKNLETGEILSESITGTTGSAAWGADNKTIFYTLKDAETLRSYKIMRHQLGTDPSVDTVIFEETDDTFRSTIYKTKSEKYLVIGSFSTVSNEFWVLEADNPMGAFRLFEPRQRHHEYSIDHAGDSFYIITNWEAQNFRLMCCTEGVTSRTNWVEVIPHRPDVLLEGLDIFKNHLILSERKDGLTQLRVFGSDGNDHYLDFKEEVYMAYTGVNPDYDTDIVRVGFMSMTTPSSVLDYDVNKHEFTLLKREAVLDDSFDPKNYVSKRIYATATDGVKVPISIVYRKDTFRKRRQPLLLYAYGSYGHSMDPYFSSPRLSLLDRGFVYAIAHIRGGQELGRNWYEDGKLLKKKNTFTDFIACAETLITEGYCAKSKLTAMGGSAGGLLMGAVMNMRPDLWRGVVAAVPFVDVVTTMLDESIPLTTGEFDEWGNPKDKTYYNYIKSYSPYDQVEAKAYPPTLITTGLHDSQVQYWEPAKWIARLRELRTNKRTPLYMFCNMTTGHGGASGRFERYKETAMEYAFLMDLVGITN